eukprot:6192304-Heterocapsa_arctica.AAC.1
MERLTLPLVAIKQDLDKELHAGPPSPRTSRRPGKSRRHEDVPELHLLHVPRRLGTSQQGMQPVL